MEKNLKFVKPKNEATAKFYTEVLKKTGWVLNPTYFYPRNQLKLILTDVFELDTV